MNMFDKLGKIAGRPKPFEHYTSLQLWSDPHISKGMLKAHLDPELDSASFSKLFIDKSVNWMSSYFGISEKTKICDFGCGPGLWTTRFAERGASVTGIDFSERSIRYAQNVAHEKNLPIRYILQDYLEFSTDDRFDLITMINADFSVLSPEQRNALLQTFHSLLNDNSAVLLDVVSMKYFDDTEEKSEYFASAESGFWSAGPHHVFTNTFKYDKEKLLVDKYTVVERNRDLEILTWLQCYDIAAIKELFEKNGLRITGVFSDVAGVPIENGHDRIAVAAMKSA
jgi:SAM-dependent methyltransferase